MARTYKKRTKASSRKTSARSRRSTSRKRTRSTRSTRSASKSTVKVVLEVVGQQPAPMSVADLATKSTKPKKAVF